MARSHAEACSWGREGGSAAHGPWLDLEDLVEVERTSEDVAHPIEAALLPGLCAGVARGRAWGAEYPCCSTSRRLRRIWLRSVEAGTECTQEFVLRRSPAAQAKGRCLTTTVFLR